MSSNKKLDIYFAHEVTKLETSKELKKALSDKLSLSTKNAMAKIYQAMTNEALKNLNGLQDKLLDLHNSSETNSKLSQEWSKKIWIPKKVVKLPELKYSKEYEEKKNKEAQEFTRKLQEEQIERVKRQEKYWKELEERMKEEEELKKKQEEINEEKIKEEIRDKKIQELYEKSDRRKQLLEKQKNEMSPIPHMKPLYKKLEEEFELKCKLNKEIKSKELEERKKHWYSPSDYERTNEYLKKQTPKEDDFANSKKSESINDLHNLNDYKLHEYLENEKKEKQKYLEHLQEKKLLLQKRNQYGKYIKETHQPSIDNLKRHEMELIKERLAMPVKKKIQSSTPSLQHFSMKYRAKTTKQKSARIETPGIDSSQENSKKNKSSNPMYLEERRKIREKLAKNINHNVSKSFDFLGKDLVAADNSSAHNYAKELEFKAFKQENLIKYLDPLNVSSIQAEENVNDMIIRSIRTKLSLLS
ncbi:unnamed protein product [Blepharisma stoltei]|uniref:Uncharacterized protein n=1 Tax=Blepharisma stoltei TaxID=1481888 RepID=A0AAU9JSE9_9CILI|nr:unnamed protein product [Blepharisma stoltei]